MLAARSTAGQISGTPSADSDANCDKRANSAIRIAIFLYHLPHALSPGPHPYPRTRRRRRLCRAGRSAGPSIDIGKPAKFVGTSTPLEVSFGAPRAKLTSARVIFEQGGKQTPLYTLENAAGATVKMDGPDKLVVSRDIGKQAIPDLKSGPARILVTASRKVFRGIRTVESTATRDVQVRLERPTRLRRVEQTLHEPRRIRDGGVSRDARGRRVGRAGRRSRIPRLPGDRRHGRGVSISDPSLRIAFFALRYDQDLKTPMHLFARDEAGNSARARLRLPDVPEAVQEEPHPAGRQVPRPRRAGDPRRDDRGEAGRRSAREVPGHQRRAAPEERGEDCVAGEGDARRRCSGAASCSTRSRTTPSSPRSPTSAPTSTRARKSTSRPTSASTSPRSPACRSSPPTAARSSTPTSSGSTATA